MSDFAVGSFGMTFSRNISELTFWKFAQTIGAGPGLSVGPSAMSHSKHIKERHQTRLSLTVSLLGSTLAPVFGGFVAQRLMAVQSDASGYMGIGNMCLHLSFP
ncbi:hypothetical protein DFJ43DRAFT_1096575 [Lentinula guzmanii]|uniref:Major facilitator superfamily (MFS) profile domain-containing protein n=1 Tax=Lentinula guzmanii TaxID=2804957 RepID=A0AA38MRK4_9AGAR|nr:hypothetical protein DFJ43DRAFT_1096575 [Lentinula guzmanii]